MTQSIHGVVLRSEDAGDFDQKVMLYTREFGKFRAKVAGVKKSASKLRSLTIPFAESRLQIYLHGTIRVGVNDPGKVIGGETLVSHEGLRRDWNKVLQASIFAETLDVLTQTFFPNPEEYALLTKSLGDIEESSQPALVRLRSTLILLKVLGYSLRHHPFWKSLAGSGQSLLIRLGGWNLEEGIFSDGEMEALERITQYYLALFLPAPLKSEIFLKKLEAALPA